MKHFLIILFLTCTSIVLAQNVNPFMYEYSGFTVEKIEHNDYHELKLCGDNADSCISRTRLANELDFETFHMIIAMLIDSYHADDVLAIKTDKNLEQYLKKIYHKLYPNEAQIIALLLEGEVLSGSQITIKQQRVQLYKKVNREEIPVQDNFLIIDSVAFTISDNFIRNIVIMGTVIDETGTIYLLREPIYNSSYSLPLYSGEKENLSYIKIQEKLGSSPNRQEAQQQTIINDSLLFFYNDVFDFLPSRTGSYSFGVRDEEFILKPNESKELKKRGVYDYLSILIFSDLIGLGDNQSNDLLQSELTVRLPIRNWSKYSTHLRWLAYADASIKMSLYNGSQVESELLNINSILIDSANISTVPDAFNIGDTIFSIDHFDLLRNNNVALDIRFALVSWERKRTNLHVQGIMGMNTYRSGFTHRIIKTGEDEVANYQQWAIAPYVALNLQYKPDLNFGAEFFTGIHRLTKRNGSNNTPLIYESNGIYRDNGEIAFLKMTEWDRWIASFNLNLYAHLNDKSKGGLFARISGHYSGANNNFFPQILVGYSTNLDNYIGRLRK